MKRGCVRTCLCLMKLFLMNFYRVGLRKHFVTYFTLEGPLLGVTTHVHIALGGSPEALAALLAGERLGSTVYSLMNRLLASLAKGLGTEGALERL